MSARSADLCPSSVSRSLIRLSDSETACCSRASFKLHSSRPKNAKRIHEALRDTPGFIRADFAFDGEAEIYFTKEALPTVAELAGARKKRQLTPEQKEELVKQGAANRFKSKIDGVEDRIMALI